MILSQHPEYEKYLADKVFIDSVHTDLSIWAVGHEDAYQRWKTAVFQLITLFQQYNQTMWQDFPFCQMCQGGCCVADASEVTTVDAAVLSILAQPGPVLPDQTLHDKRACIYLGKQGCTWSDEWRPLKCMAFFSLGNGNWQLDSADQRYNQLAQALRIILRESLPKIIGKEETIDIQTLAEPVSFAAMLSHQLVEQFLPAHLASNNGRSRVTSLIITPYVPITLTKLAEQILAEPPEMGDQFLLDLEQLEWLAMGHPAHEEQILTEINSRYAPFIDEHPTYLQLTQYITQYRQSIKRSEAP